MEKKKYTEEKNIKRSQILSAIRKGRSSEVITRLILELESFIEKNKSTNVSKSKLADKEKIAQLKGRVAELEYYLTTQHGLWALDVDPKKVTKKEIIKRSFRIDNDV